MPWRNLNTEPLLCLHSTESSKSPPAAPAVVSKYFSRFKLHAGPYQQALHLPEILPFASSQLSPKLWIHCLQVTLAYNLQAELWNLTSILDKSMDPLVPQGKLHPSLKTLTTSQALTLLCHHLFSSAQQRLHLVWMLTHY